MNIGRFPLSDEQLQSLSIFPIRVLTAVVKQYQSQINNLNDADHVVRYLKKACHNWWKDNPAETDSPIHDPGVGPIAHHSANTYTRRDGVRKNWLQEEIIYLKRTVAGLNGSDHAAKYKQAWGKTPQQRLHELEIYDG